MTVPLDLKTFEFISLVQTAILAKAAFPLKQREIHSDTYNGNSAAVQSARDLQIAFSYIQQIPNQLRGQDAASDYIRHVFEGEPAAHWMRSVDE
ncbi:MAG: hypothetical protein H7Z73_00575 [Candidatus Saccharibacteria bacterium]|nr:hypothetical protein [Moraxellaceae bacterium]